MNEDPHICFEGHAYNTPTDEGKCPICDADYQAGIKDAEDYKRDVQMLGQEAADKIEFWKEFNRG
jgi:hypothetical protein